MKFIYRLPAMAIGLLALATGASSCGNDDDSSPECCTVTDSFSYYGNNLSFTYTSCSDGTYTLEEALNGTVVYNDSGKWDDDESLTWAQVKADFISADGTCD